MADRRLSRKFKRQLVAILTKAARRGVQDVLASVPADVDDVLIVAVGKTTGITLHTTLPTIQALGWLEVAKTQLTDELLLTYEEEDETVDGYND